MEVIIRLSDLYDSTLRFYIEDSFRREIFKRLKMKYNDWRIVANKLKMNARNLFGIRRGWDIRGT